MIKVGSSAFVVSGSVVGIMWRSDGYGTGAPVVLLQGGHEIRAGDYSTSEPTEEEKQEIILKLWEDLRAPELDAMKKTNAELIDMVTAMRSGFLRPTPTLSGVAQVMSDVRPT